MVNYYIFCHACYVPFSESKYKNPNVNLWFDTELNSESCSSELQLNFDADSYKYKESYMNPKFDYILSFKDLNYSSSETTLKMFGLFDEDEKRVEIKNITNGNYNDILLSDLLKFLLRKNERSNIYCSFCRNTCGDSVMPTNESLEFGTEADNKSNDNNNAMQDFKVARFNDEDIDFNIFGGKKKRRSRKKSYKKHSNKKYLKKKKTKTHRRNK
jgi:hypothetical protein